VTVIGINSEEESEPFSLPPLLIMEHIDAEIIGLKIDDQQEVTNVGESKWFYVHYDNIGKDPCIVVDFADGVRQAFGNRKGLPDGQKETLLGMLTSRCGAPAVPLAVI
jgi:hypothetical protein